MPNHPATTDPPTPKQHPFRRAILRGLAVLLPPLLTLVILIWVVRTVQDYVLVPIETGLRAAIRWSIDQTISGVPHGAEAPVIRQFDGEPRVVEFLYRGTVYAAIDNGHYIPKHVLERVARKPGKQMPATAEAIYDRYVELTFLRRQFVIPAFLCLFVLVLYLLGKFVAAGVGRMLWNAIEVRVLSRLPIIRHVYSSVKQVTDFIFSERELQFTRVVAVEYPRKGTWSLAFVTGESLKDLRDTAGEPVVSLMVPTSPMPATGFTITVRKSETIELNITVDQAFQFILSCGVVVPLGQQQGVGAEIAEAVRRREASAAEALRPT